MNKTIIQFTDLAGVTQYTASLSFSGGIEKPRYLVAAFQVQDLTVPGGTNTQNINYSVFNGTTATTMVDIVYVDLRVNGQLYRLTDSGNTWSANKYARWYNEFKKFRSSYLGDISDDECISFTDFRNINRLFVFDISKQTESIIGLGNANVSLEFHFNTALPAAANASSTLYVVSLFDRMWQLQADGITQKIIK